MLFNNSRIRSNKTINNRTFAYHPKKEQIKSQEITFETLWRHAAMGTSMNSCKLCKILALSNKNDEYH